MTTKYKGVSCPICKSENIVGTYIELDIASANQDCICEDCRSSWTDHYTLTGWTLLEYGDEYIQ